MSNNNTDADKNTPYNQLNEQSTTQMQLAQRKNRLMACNTQDLVNMQLDNDLEIEEPNVFKKAYKMVTMPLHKFEQFGEPVYFYFFLIRFFAVIFFILAVLQLVPIYFNVKGGGLSNRAVVSSSLRTSIANRGFDREGSKQYYEFEAQLRRNSILNNFYDNFQIFKLVGKVDVTQTGLKGPKRNLALKNNDEDQQKDQLNPTKNMGTHAKKEYWKDQYRDYWNYAWNEEFISKYKLNSNLIDPIYQLENIYDWNKAESKNLSDYFLPRKLDIDELEAFVGNYKGETIKADEIIDNYDEVGDTYNVDENYDYNSDTAPDPSEYYVPTDGGNYYDELFGENFFGDGGDYGADQTVQDAQTTTNQSYRRLISKTPPQSSRNQKLLNDKNNRNLQAKTWSYQEEAVYSQIIGSRELAMRWLNITWMKGIDKDLLKFLSPVILSVDEKMEKKVLKKKRPELRVYFDENDYEIFDNEEQFKNMQFKKRKVQFDNIVRINKMTMKELTDEHREAILTFLTKFNPDLNNSELDSTNERLSLFFNMNIAFETSILFIFLAGIFFIKYLVQRKQRRFMSTQRSVKYYALRITGFPLKGVKIQELIQYFSQFGEVQSANFTYDYEQSLFNAKNVRQTIDKIYEIMVHPDYLEQEKNIRCLNEYEKIRKDNKIKLARIFTDREGKYDTIGAFIIFNNIKTPRRIVHSFRQAYRKKWFTCGLQQIDERFLFRQKYKINFQDKDHPENILWENMEVTLKDRCVTVIKLLLPIVLLILLTLFIHTVTLVKQKSNNTTICTSDIPDELHKIQNYIANNFIKADLAKQCFCDRKNLVLNSLLKKVKIRVIDKDIEEFCHEREEQAEINNKYQTILTAVIFFSNIYIQHWTFKIKNKLRFSTETQAQVFAILFAVFLQFINTVVVFHIVYMDIAGFNLIIFLNDRFGLSSSLDNFVAVDNLGFDWYLVIAQRMIGPWVLESFKPYGIELWKCFRYWWLVFVYIPFFQKCVRKLTFPFRWIARKLNIFYRFYKGFLTITGKKDMLGFDVDKFANQAMRFDPDAQMTKLKVQREDFDVGKRYQAIIAMFLILFPFSGPIPILTICIFFSFFCSYILHKYMIQTFQEVKVKYSNEMVNQVLIVCKICIIARVLFSIWLFPRNELFPEDKELSTIFIFSDMFSITDLWKQAIRCMPLLVSFFLIIISFCLEKYILIFVGIFYEKYLKKIGKPVEIPKAYSYQQVAALMESTMDNRPQDFNIDSNEEYIALLKFDSEQLRQMKIKTVLKKNLDLVPQRFISKKKSYLRVPKYIRIFFDRANNYEEEKSLAKNQVTPLDNKKNSVSMGGYKRLTFEEYKKFEKDEYNYRKNIVEEIKKKDEIVKQQKKAQKEAELKEKKELIEELEKKNKRIKEKLKLEKKLKKKAKQNDLNRYKRKKELQKKVKKKKATPAEMRELERMKEEDEIKLQKMQKEVDALESKSVEEKDQGFVSKEQLAKEKEIMDIQKEILINMGQDKFYKYIEKKYKAGQVLDIFNIGQLQERGQKDIVALKEKIQNQNGKVDFFEQNQEKHFFKKIEGILDLGKFGDQGIEGMLSEKFESYFGDLEGELKNLVNTFTNNLIGLDAFKEEEKEEEKVGEQNKIAEKKGKKADEKK